jgi:hypothetical protein
MLAPAPSLSRYGMERDSRSTKPAGGEDQGGEFAAGRHLSLFFTDGVMFIDFAGVGGVKDVTFFMRRD